MLAACKGLFSASPAAIDELVVLGVLGMVWYCALGLYAVLVEHQPFSPLTYASGIATVLGALGGAKRWRDGPGGTDSTDAPDNPADPPAGGS